MRNVTLILILIFLLSINPVCADQILRKKAVFDKGISVGEEEKFILSSGAFLELTESRFEEGVSQILINGTLLMKGKKDKPAVISFKERAFDFKDSKLQPIDIDEETLVYLPESAALVEYRPRKYYEKGFGNQINDFLFNASKFYPILFFLAATAVASR